MARLKTSATPRAAPTSEIYRDPSPDSEASETPRRRMHSANEGSRHPSSRYRNLSSDKENRFVSESRATPAKNKQTGQVAPRTSMDEAGSSSNKRRRLGEHNVSLEGRAADDATPTTQLVDLEYYDPNQDPNQRRQLRLDMRRNFRDITDRRDELQQPENNQLRDYIRISDQLMARVRQTADATIDSRFLVQASDIALKKTTNLVHGDSSTGIDVDDFVTRCIAFMRNGGSLDSGDNISQRRHGRSRSVYSPIEDDVDEEDLEEDGDALDWEILGARACISSNRRPPVPSFLLGPLSLQKRTRAPSQRRPGRGSARDAAAAPATRPQELNVRDLEQAESSNLTTLCANISQTLQNHIADASETLEQELTSDPSLEDEGDDSVLYEMMQKYRLAQNREGQACVSLFDFAINPDSFGQTIENLFYISFLIRDGNAKIENDVNGLPILTPAESRSLTEKRAQNVVRNQAVFSLDYGTWEKLVQAYNIVTPLIPHRDDTEGVQVAASGWYG